ncbi:HRDC domain-containing protein [Luteococcus sanguinis]|uniref:HRDC domain-containing protein n=1 Tax=Luteococcus sanguinis TaxID=174038 RepID=A0ABW1X0W8_9ACTN
MREEQPISVGQPISAGQPNSAATPAEATRPKEQAPLPVLDMPADGIPEVVDTPAALAACIESLRPGTGPVAVDAERAQSFRYSAKSYLFQLRRAGSGSFIIDPIAFEDGSGRAQLGDLSEAIEDAEWVIHAATQDLPCLVEAGMVPERIFDTELAGRLLGLPRVGLGAMVEQYFGLHLLKEHSAADWSRRPIPSDWLVYAALDVELLVELREKLAADLAAAGKLEWAEQEFAHLVEVYRQPPEPTGERWRRTSGMHTVRSPLGLAVVRELWTTRDEIARRLDKAPGKVVQDKAISELAGLVGRPPAVPTKEQMRRIDGFKRRTARQYENNWLAALERVAELPARELPPVRTPLDGPPMPRQWERRWPDAFARWNAARPATQQLAEKLSMPPENLVSPDTLRRITFEPPVPLTHETIDARLAELGARPWQRQQLVPVLLETLDS